MAYLNEEAKWEPGIYQYETSDPLLGGPDGIDNVQGKQLGNRTKWLKEKMEASGAKTENGPLAANDYDAGDQFFLEGVLYTATVAIAAGEAFAEGENCEAAGTTGAQLARYKAEADAAIEASGVHVSALADESKCRNLLDVLGIRAAHSDNPASEAEAKACILALHDKMEAGDFSGLRIGDYLDLSSLTVDGTTYTWVAEYRNLRLMIMGFNVYKHAGDTENVKDHVVMQFRNCVLEKRMNATGTNAGGYPASELYTWLNDKFKAGLVAAIGNHLYTIRRLLSTKGNWAWGNDTVFLPTETEVWGTEVWSEKIWNGFQAQWPAYRDSVVYKVKTLNGSRKWWWEASPREDEVACFCYCDYSWNGGTHATADLAGGIPPDSVRRRTSGLMAEPPDTEGGGILRTGCKPSAKSRPDTPVRTRTGDRPCMAATLRRAVTCTVA